MPLSPVREMIFGGGSLIAAASDKAAEVKSSNNIKGSIVFSTLTLLRLQRQCLFKKPTCVSTDKYCETWRVTKTIIDSTTSVLEICFAMIKIV